MLVEVRPSNEALLRARVPGAQDQRGCTSHLFHRAHSVRAPSSQAGDAGCLGLRAFNEGLLRGNGASWRTGGWRVRTCALREHARHPRAAWKLCSLKRGGQGCPSLRASSDHCFIVGALRARRAPGHPAHFYSPFTGMYMTFPCRLTSRSARSEGLIGSASR